MIAPMIARVTAERCREIARQTYGSSLERNHDLAFAEAMQAIECAFGLDVPAPAAHEVMSAAETVAALVQGHYTLEPGETPSPLGQMELAALRTLLRVVGR